MFLSVFADHFVNRGRVPADDLIEEFCRRGRLDVECFRNLESRWSEVVAKADDPEALL
jgi:hypothetical protein